MTKQKILTDLYTSAELADFLAKMKPENLREDIKQELFVVLCEQPDDKIIALHERKQLRFFAVRIVMNMVQSTKSRFYYKFRKNVSIELPEFSNLNDTADVDVLQYEKDFAEKVDKTKKAIDELPWYQNQVITQYLENGSAGKMVKDMEERLGMSVPKRSILDTVNKAKAEIRRKVPQ